MKSFLDHYRAPRASWAGLLRITPSGSAGRIDSLTSLRFVAAFWVLAYHYRSLVPFPPPVRRLANVGYAGVGAFFVLSGFVLFYNYSGWFLDGVSKIDLKRFARARFARIYPLHVLTLLLITPFVVWLVVDHRVVGEQALGSSFNKPPVLAASWLTNLLLLQIYIPLDAFTQFWNVPSWSIACEAAFYVIFPFFLAKVLSRVSSLWACIGVLAGLFSAELLTTAAAAWAFLAIYGPAAFWWFADRVSYRLPPLRVWEFLIGCTLGALLSMYRRDPTAKTGLSRFENEKLRNVAVGVALIGIAILSFNPTRILPSGAVGLIVSLIWSNAAFTPIFAILVFALASGRTFLSWLLDHPLLILLGDASYSLYLLQWLPRQALLSGLIPMRTSWATALVAMAATIAVSVVSYRIVETPLRRLLRGARHLPTGAPYSRASAGRPTRRQPV